MLDAGCWVDVIWNKGIWNRMKWNQGWEDGEMGDVKLDVWIGTYICFLSFFPSFFFSCLRRKRKREREVKEGSEEIWIFLKTVFWGDFLIHTTHHLVHF